MDRANAQLRRTVEVLDTSARFDVQTVSATAALSLTYPLTLVLVDTGSGNVTLTLPAVAAVPGFRVEVKKTTAANTLTVDGAGSETIDGAGTLAWSTQWQSYSLIATGGAWYVV
jgi:hypothetical protein